MTKQKYYELTKKFEEINRNKQILGNIDLKGAMLDVFLLPEEFVVQHKDLFDNIEEQLKAPVKELIKKLEVEFEAM